MRQDPKVAEVNEILNSINEVIIEVNALGAENFTREDVEALQERLKGYMVFLTTLECESLRKEIALMFMKVTRASMYLSTLLR